MNCELEEMLHPRILKHCSQLVGNGHFKHAAIEAMTQVELALKEKSLTKNKYGVNLAVSLFGLGKGIKLRVPLGDDMQLQAEQLFRATFSYYRNYAVHDGSKIDRKICLRVMILASELLDLIGASAVSFADVGGLPGIVESGIFKDEDSVKRLLFLLTDYVVADDNVDWLYEELAAMGLGEDNVTAVIDLGLVEYFDKPYITSLNRDGDTSLAPDKIGWFILTPLGKEISTRLR